MANVGGDLHLILKDARIKQGLSQKKLGELVDLPQQAINRIEHGQRKLDIELFEKLCEVLNIKKIGNFNINFISNFYKMDDEPGAPDIYFNGLNEENTQTNTIFIDTSIDEHHPYQKYLRGEQLTAKEEEQLRLFLKDIPKRLPNSIKRLGSVLEKHYQLLNEEGQKKANEQMNHAVEQVKMLTKIPEYQKNQVSLLSGIEAVKKEIDLSDDDCIIEIEATINDTKED